MTPLAAQLRCRLRRAGRRRDTIHRSQREQAVQLALGVLAQHEAVLDHVADRVDHLAVIVLERRIALLDRTAWIAGADASGGRPGERDELACGLAPVVGLVTG